MPYTPDHLLWIDPGGMTGLAMLDKGQLIADEYPFQPACARIETMCTWYGTGLHIGYERFTIGPSTHKLSPQPEAYELPGVIRYLAAKHECVLLKPALPEQRLRATPRMLQALGWWPEGKDDAQSACQHLLSWMERSNCVPDSVAAKLARLRS